MSDGDASVSEEDVVWGRVLTMYRLAERGDSAAVDALIADDATLWDTDEAGLVRGLVELQTVRARRPDPGEHAAFEIEAADPLVSIWGETALVRHVFRVRSGGGKRWLFVRNTSVWRRSPHEWLLTHNHEDVLGDAGSVGRWSASAAERRTARPLSASASARPDSARVESLQRVRGKTS